MKRIGLAYAVVAAALLSGCAGVQPQKPAYPIARPEAPPPPPPPPPTPLDEFAWSTARGSNTLVATVAFRARPGERWSCAGQSVGLTPETSYSRSRMQILYGSADRAVRTVAEIRSRSAANAGLDYGQFVKSTACDAKESFSFQGLPDGSWFVIVRVRPVAANGQPTAEGLVVMQRVEVRGGGPHQVTLSAAQPAPAPAQPRRRPAG